MQLIEIKYLRTIQGCTRIDRVKNDDNMNEIKIQLIQYEMEVLRPNWMNYFERYNNKDKAMHVTGRGGP
jgi:hypothetical protein